MVLTATLPQKTESQKQPLTATYPLSEAQKAFWSHYQQAPESPLNNIYLTVRIASELDLEAWHRAWERIADKHSIFRTAYTAEGGEPVRVSRPHSDLEIGVIDASSWSEKELKSEIYLAATCPFNLEMGTAIRTYLFKRSPSEYVQVIALSKIAGDFWSLNLLARDFQELYAWETAITRSA